MILMAGERRRSAESLMPLYYFDVADNGASVTDEFGVELEDVFEAREQAIALLPDMARNELPDGDRHEFSASVRSHEGRVHYVATLVFEGHWVEPPSSVADGPDAPAMDRSVARQIQPERGLTRLEAVAGSDGSDRRPVTGG